ncbi:L10-interacting MYB domain-containing protein-like [Argentina anserina]|uniref:L10-interacting MYB domain-containing protein-like n=1 Tax=Argentina anserina TaxID=57926 RepID=UPI00217682FA|nr:L10-interacting MYB domain-containing protein-like [Potentilla anserina]
MANSKEQACWNESLVEVFVDICIKELKNKWDALKGEWRLWKDLKNKYTGLGWDPKLNTVVATEERWSQIIGEFARFKKKGISPEFETKLDILFSDITATGKHAWAPSSSIPIPNSLEEGDNVNYVEGSGDSDERDVSNYTRSSKRKRSERALKDKEKVPKKVGGVAQLAKEIGRMCSAIESRSTTSSIVNNARTSITEVMKDVTSLPGAEQGTRLWFFATRLFLSAEKRDVLHYGRS